MSRRRTFTKIEITDAIAAAARGGMVVRFLPSGEMRVEPHIPQATAALTLDVDAQSEADRALSEWEAQYGSHVEGRA